MALTRDKKKEIIKKVHEAIDSSKSAVFVNFHGLNVSKISKMRRALQASGVGYLVAKKTLARKALEGIKVDGKLPDMPGELAIIFGTDPIAPAREIYKFQKEYKDGVKIVGGIFDR